MINYIDSKGYIKNGLLISFLLIFILSGRAFTAYGEGFTLVVAPQLCFVQYGQPKMGGGPPSDELTVDSGWGIGGLMHGIHKRFIFEVFPFYAKVSDIKTIGDIAYADVYPFLRGNFYINAGFGLVTIFNRSEAVDTDIISPFPLVGVKYKFGKYGSYINPWVGFMYDIVNVDFESPMAPDIKERDRSLLIGARFGLTPLPFFTTVTKFYYKRCFDDVDKKNTYTFTNRTNIYFSKVVGATTYIDYRQFTDGAYMLMVVGGPAFCF